MHHRASGVNAHLGFPPGALNLTPGVDACKCRPNRKIGLIDVPSVPIDSAQGAEFGFPAPVEADLQPPDKKWQPAGIPSADGLKHTSCWCDSERKTCRSKGWQATRKVADRNGWAGAERSQVPDR